VSHYRLGVVPYLNAKPLVYDLEQNPRPNVTLVEAVPSALLERLRAGELDAAVVSSVACLDDGRLVPLAGHGVAAFGPVDSIRLFCKEEPGRLRRVALDTSSRTSTVLARILLAECFGARPEYVSMGPDLEAMLAAADAGLLIGDPAMRAHYTTPWERAGLRSLDLGELWGRLTGLPFVYAAWIAPRELETGPLVRLLAEACEAALPHLDAIGDAASVRLGLPQAACRNYLRNVMVYDLGPREWEGLRRFQALAIRHGLLPPDAPPVAVRGG